MALQQNKKYLKPWTVAVIVMVLQLIGAAQSAEGLRMVVWDLFIMAGLLFIAWNNKVYQHLAIGFSGVVLCLLADPATGWWFAVWFMLIPMFFVIRDIDHYPTLFGYGQWIGWLITIGLFSWLWTAMNNFFEPSIFFTMAMLTLVGLITGVQFSFFFLLAKFIFRKLPLWLAGVLSYSFVEFWIPLLFPIQLAMALSWTPGLIQGADLIGISGISFLIALVNGLLFWFYQSWTRGQWRQVAWAGSSLLALLVVQIGYGLIGLNKYSLSPEDKALRVAMIQPVSPLKVMNKDHETKSSISEKLKVLSIEAVAEGTGSTDLLIWPEGAAAFSWRSPDFNPEYSDALSSFLDRYPVTMLMQDIEFVRLPGAPDIHYYSTATLIAPDGEILDGYRKTILLPFAEYLPGQNQFPFLEKIFTQTRSILKGEEKTLLSSPDFNIIPLICYEVLFGDFVREFVLEGNGQAQCLVNLTNDRWYGKHQQPWQHLCFAVFRSVENRLPMIRSTNSGISAIIDSRGIIQSKNRTSIGEQTILRGEASLATQPGLTLYTRYGDWLFYWILTPVVIIAGILSAPNAFPKKETQPGPIKKTKKKKKSK